MRIKVEDIALIASLIVCALLLLGFIPTRFDSNQPHITIREQYVVKAGDTFWEIGERNYDPEKEVRSFAQYMSDFRNKNGFKVGDGRKYLQVGETLTIEKQHKI